jgi:hypothetical protein
MNKILLWGIFITNIFGFSYLVSTNYLFPWIITIVSIFLIVIIDKKT